MARKPKREGPESDVRRENLRLLEEHGFKVAKWLPTHSSLPGLRPADEIARRFMALGVLFLWVADAGLRVEDKKLRDTAKKNDLVRGLAADEAKTFALSRAKARAAHRDAIGWKLENMWSLAWALGFEPEPAFDGAMIDDDVLRPLFAFLPKSTDTVEGFLSRAKPRSAEEVARLEDLFYCAHNAVRSAQLGSDTVPEGFHPVMNGGVVHERRHGLTWCLSRGVSWDDTDLST
jgi:hypothetical protein